MRRNNAEAIGSILLRYLRAEGLETPLNETRMERAWGEVMGKAILRYTRNVSVRNQTLYVALSSPALKANLMMMRQKLVEKLNSHVGAQVIERIVFK